MRLIHLAAPAALFCAAGIAQTTSFELTLPELNQTIPGDTVLVEVPVRPLSRMMVQLLGSADKNLNYGDLRVRINGKGVRNVFDSGSNERGKFLIMTPQTLRMRPDQIFDPRENTIEVYGKDRRGRAYYQNWILRSGREDVNPFFSYLSARSPNDETGIPPDLNLGEPTVPVYFPPGSKTVAVRLKGSASAASGIAALTINQKPAKSANGIPVMFDETVAVQRGDKNVAIEAADMRGNRRSILVPVTYPSEQAPKIRGAGQSVAVIIGVSRFSSENAPPVLPAASFEARQLAQELQTHGFKNENIRLLVDERATAEQFRTALGDFAATAKPEDLLLIYIATQGLHDPTAPEKIYLAAGDTRLDRLSETALELTDVQLLLNRAIRSRHTLLFFDAQHALGAELAFQGKSIVNTHLLNLFDGSLGRSVMVSGSAGQDSRDVADKGVTRSVFSGTLLEGLKGKADVDHNGVITAKEICAYVSETVQRSTRGEQYPQFRVSETEAEAPVLALR